MAESKPHPLKRTTGVGLHRQNFGPLRYEAIEGQHRDEVYEFVRAVDEYKRLNGEPFPRTADLLDVALYLGYRKVAPRAESIDDLAEVVRNNQPDLSELRWCERCASLKPNDDFQAFRRGPQKGRRCLLCRACLAMAKRRKRCFLPSDLTKTKTCRRCKMEKPVGPKPAGQFTTSPWHRDGYYPYCNQCRRKKK